MTRARVPVLATLVVALAVLAMIGLGVWQLQRLQWKEALLARYAGAVRSNAEVPFPVGRAAVEQSLYRHSRVDCQRVIEQGAVAGRAPEGWTGWAITAQCDTQYGPVLVMLGWADTARKPAWQGGPVSGILAPGRNGAARLVADPPQAGLHALARPDPNDIPNNHFAYAMQWFLFAAVAVGVFVVALRKRNAGS